MKKNTKSALLLSVVSIILCCTMLLGTTMAWFTDSVTSASNIIKAGNLDIKMYYLDGEEYLDVEDEDTDPIFNYDLWEPGYTEYRVVKIENAGSLAFKYTLNIVPTGEVGILADVIDVYYADGEVALTRETLDTAATLVGTLSDVIGGTVVANGTLNPKDENVADSGVVYVTIALKMQESAGNEYMNKSVGDAFDIQLLATQLASESDSFDNQYDADAEYGNVVKTFDELKMLIANGGNIVLGSDIEVTGMVEIPVNGSVSIDGQGYTLTRGDSYTGTILSLGEYAELALSNITLDGENVESTGNLIYIDSFGKLILNDGTVLENHVGGTTYDSARGPENSVIHCDGATTIVMNDGSVIQNNVSKGSFATVIASMYDLTCELNGGKIINNTSEKNNYTVNFGNYANITVSDGFEAYGNTDGGLMRVNQQSTFTMNGGKLDGNGKSAIYTWVAKYVTLNGGEIIGNVNLNYAPATVGGTDVDGYIQKDKEVTKWALNLTPDFGTVRYKIDGNITQLNIVPADGYTYVAGDETKLVCENAGYETYWDAESGCFKVKASE